MVIIAKSLFRIALAAALALAVFACGDDDEGGGALSCQYEQSRTGCGGGSFGPFESRCLTVDDPKEGLTPEGWCDIVTGDTLECGGGCCVSFRFRNAVGFRGSCN